MSSNEKLDVVARFWEGIDSHDWDLIESTLAPDFVRIGMRDDEEDTSSSRDDYMQFVRTVIGRMDHHDLEVRTIWLSDDGTRAYAECIETIDPPGEERLVMRFANVMELNGDGLISKLDIFWKTPPRMPPEWITPEALRGADGA